MGRPAKRIMIEDLARACGVEHVEVIDPYNLEAAKREFVKMLEVDGVAMVIARRDCATVALRAMRPRRPVPYHVDPDSCIGCRICSTEFGCPALSWIEEAERPRIDKALCMGCGVCSQVCPRGAILIGEAP